MNRALLKYLLDTNVVSEPAKPRPNEYLLEQLREHEDAAAISSITWHELRCGVSRLPEGRRKKELNEYLRAIRLPILDYDQRAAEWHAEERARLEKKGRLLPYGDGQIAAIAAANRLTLVTANEKDFKVFADLTVTNWMR
ncbi:type II toxin-antitoxin system VapC family toxin [Pendulispora rubella]|uniref:Ribonuclease VapC n=1 Tax=Pendulispora rubella TaxID=2741070 RepID=A0ABZ2LCK9_9BACT